ncbi:MAG TPA: universal stress protein [Alphaproteobacteria bacterium]|nr:universal stress protein [Alphaproteobacteria bacterium]
MSAIAAVDDHRQVFLVVLESSIDMKLPLYYAFRMAKRVQGRVSLLYVIEPNDLTEWQSVGNLMYEQQRQEAERVLQKAAAFVHGNSGIFPALFIREGGKIDQTVQLAGEDESISALVIVVDVQGKASGTISAQWNAKLSARLKVPLIIVPNNLTEEDIQRVT